MTDEAYTLAFVAGVLAGVSKEREVRNWVETAHGMSEGFVYFMGVGSPYITHVKIGFTAGLPHKRLAQLQTGCPLKLDLIGYVFGTHAMEASLHDALIQWRTSGEWFEYSDAVASVVRQQLEATVLA